MAGGGSGAITKTAIAPLERVKIIFQIQGMHGEVKPKYSGIFNTLKTVIKEDGFLALYKGNGANVVRIIPTYAIKFSSNDQIRAMVLRPGQSVKDLSFQQMMACGTAAGLLQICCTYPLETVRTRLSLAESMSNGVRYKGIMDCFTHTIRTEGVPALYKGIGPTFLSGSPYVGLQMTFFELFKRWLPKGSVSRHVHALTHAHTHADAHPPHQAFFAHSLLATHAQRHQELVGVLESEFRSVRGACCTNINVPRRHH